MMGLHFFMPAHMVPLVEVVRSDATDPAVAQSVFELMRQLRGRVSGLCQPDYVIVIPGGAGKSPVGPSYVLAVQNTAADAREAEKETRYRIVDYCGDVHLYPPET